MRVPLKHSHLSEAGSFDHMIRNYFLSYISQNRTSSFSILENMQSFVKFNPEI